MIPLITSGLVSVLRSFSNSSEGKSSGITEDAIGALEAWATKDQRAIRQLADTLNEAREHDKATYGNSLGGQVVDFFRGMVRPSISYAAMGWYLYARVNNIELGNEDYALIGGVLAFWFGGRLISRDWKRNKNSDIL